MKSIQLIILALTFALAPADLRAMPPLPPAPTLAEALKLDTKNVVIFRPIKMPASATFNLSHIRMADGSVKPGDTRGALLAIYSSVPDVNGDHALLFSAFHQFSNDGSPVATFPSFNPARDAANAVTDGRCGIIAILIGLNQPRGTVTFKPASLPASDTIAAEILPADPTAIGLLLPAVQKVRAAAARL